MVIDTPIFYCLSIWHYKMILTLLLWKVKGCHYFIEVLLIIFSKTKYDINHYSIRKCFLNQKEKKKKRMLSLLYFPFLFLQQTIYWRVITYLFRETIFVDKIKKTSKKEHNRWLVSLCECRMYHWTTQQTKHKRKGKMSC